jgi:hypothetical protein
MELWRETRDHAAYVISVGAAIAGYLMRRRASGDGTLLRDRLTSSWISRRLAAEGNLARCEDERRNDQASFTRQLADREAEITYLVAKTQRLMSEGRAVMAAVDHVSVLPSEPSPAVPTKSPTPSPNSPRPSRKSPGKTTKDP